MPVTRCCNGTYEEPTDSRRQHTVAICVPDGAGWSKRVCKKTFKDFLLLHLLKSWTIRKNKLDDTVYKVKRGRVKSSICKFTLADINQVKKKHIKSGPWHKQIILSFQRKISTKQCVLHVLSQSLYNRFSQTILEKA